MSPFSRKTKETSLPSVVTWLKKLGQCKAQPFNFHRVCFSTPIHMQLVCGKGGLAPMNKCACKLSWYIVYLLHENIPILPSGLLDFCKQKLWPLLCSQQIMMQCSESCWWHFQQPDLNTKDSYFEHIVFVITHMNTMFGIWLYRV